MLSMNVEFCERLVATLAHSLWQGLFTGIVFAVVTTLLRSRGPEIRYAIGVICLAVLVVCVPTTFLLNAPQQLHEVKAITSRPSRSQAGASLPSVENRAEMDATPAPIGNGTGLIENTVIETWHVRWQRLASWLSTFYLFGVVIGLTRLGRGIWDCHVLRRATTPMTDLEWLRRVELVRVRIGLRVAPAVFWCRTSLLPTVVGIVRPVILLPVTLTTGLTAEQMEQILCHEMMHVRRLDALINLLVSVAEILLFFHPVVWIISRRIRLERELCCDTVSAYSKDERWRYAQLLVRLAERAYRPSVAANQLSIVSDPSQLRVRIEALLRRPGTRNGFIELRSFVLLTIIVLGLMLFASCSAPSAPRAEDPSAIKAEVSHSDRAISENHHDEIHKITVTTVQSKAVTVTEQYVCQIRSHRHVEIRASAKGNLEAIPIKEGQQVTEGQPLFKVIPIRYQSKLEAENASAKLAQLEFNFTKKQFEDKVVSQNEVLLLEAKLSKATATAKLAAAELDLATVNAPFDGIVGRLSHQQGSLVLEGEALTTLSDNSVMWVYFNVPDARYLEFMADQSHPKENLQFELLLTNGKKFEQVGKFGTIEADFNEETGAIPFRVDFPNPERMLRHGQRGTVLISRALNDAIVIPQRAAFEELNKRYVYMVDKDDVAHRREIVIQNELEDLFVIKQGVSVEEKIILDGNRQVHDGDEVKYEERQSKKAIAN